MSTVPHITDNNLTRSQMGLIGSDFITAIGTLELGASNWVDDTGADMLDDTGDNLVFGAADASEESHTGWWKLSPRIKSETVVLAAGCVVLDGETPPAGTSATAADPLIMPFTKIVLGATSKDAIAVRLSK